MLKRIFLPITLVILTYGFWISPNFSEISAGVAIFLFGMMFLEDGFKTFSGGTLESILEKSTDKLYKSISLGIVSTTIMQSSSLVSVLTISFLSAGLIGLLQGIGIVFGANIGTTTGAWLIAGFGLKIKISTYAMPMLVFGVLLVFQKSKTFKGIGYILAGLGFLFLGIHYMKEGFEAFKDTINLIEYGGTGVKYLFIFIGIGVVATVIMQSSHATFVIIITALAAHQISYENAIALAIGANVGTTITAILGALSSSIDGKRLALGLLISKILTGVIAVIFMKEMLFSVDFMCDLFDISSTNYTLKLAMYHTIFNVMGLIIMLPFINLLIKFLNFSIKEDNVKTKIQKSKYLNDTVLEIPEMAIMTLLKESKHLYDNAFEIIAHGLNLKCSNIISALPHDVVIQEQYSNEPVNISTLYNNNIKYIYGDIVIFSTRAQENMNIEDIDLLYQFKLANRNIVESINNVKYIQKSIYKYKNSSNEYIKKQYNIIRKDLSDLLRNINLIKSTNEEDVILLLLSKIKLHAKKHDILLSGTLDELIRNRLITNEMATSLMNDSSYAHNISKNLIYIVETLFIDMNSDIKIIGDDLQIDENEINEILKN